MWTSEVADDRLFFLSAYLADTGRLDYRLSIGPFMHRHHPDRGLFGWPPDRYPKRRLTDAQRRRLFQRQDRWRLQHSAADRRSFFVF